MTRAADNSQQPIELPDATKLRITRLIGERDKAKAVADGKNSTINELLDLSRELMNVPPGWRLENIEIGFEPPPVTEQTPT